MRIALVGFIVAIIIQLCVIVKLSDNSSIKETAVMATSSIKPKPQLGYIINKINKIGNSKVINVKKDGDKYIVDVEVDINKDEFIEIVQKLSEFEFKDFNLESNNNDISGTITIEN